MPELVPIRYGRMSASPFAFYRGATYVMASDLAGPRKTLDVWYAQASVSDLRRLLRSTAGGDRGRRFDQAVAKGRRKDSSRAFAKLAVLGNGEARIRADPPLIVPIADLLDRSAALRLELSARKLLESYVAACPVIAGACWSGIDTSTSRARSWVWEEWGHAAG